MMKKFLKGEKAISLITLSITVIVLIVITNVVIYNLRDNLSVERLRNMQNDIENLRDKVDTYYLQYGTIPIIEEEYTNTDSINSKSVNDSGKFYVIDLKAIDNLTLTYGEDYRSITSGYTAATINALDDIYIINEASHNIFYVKGITVDGDTYYTNYSSSDVDTVDIRTKLRYFDGVRIPEGFMYKSGTSAKDLHITNLANTGYDFTWIPVDVEVTESTVSNYMGNNYETIDKYEVMESINRFHGYYRFYGPNIVLYNRINDNWSLTYDKDAIYTDKDGYSVKISQGFQVSRLEGTNCVRDGLVVRNAETDDRFVWIRVPDSVFKNVTSGSDYANIENDLKEYVKDYSIDQFVDAYFSGLGFEDESDYNHTKNEVLKSIYENKGFWISQYEIGASTMATSNDNAVRTPTSKRDQYVYNYVTLPQAKELAENMEIGNYKGTLLFGFQWDLVMKFIEENTTKTANEILNNSVDFGNYPDSEFDVQRGQYSVDPTTANSYKVYTETTSNVFLGSKKLRNGQALLTTGITKRNSVLNIYDLAGNVAEYTFEKHIHTNNNAARGGSYMESSYENAARRELFIGVSCDKNIGFRVGLY